MSQFCTCHCKKQQAQQLGLHGAKIEDVYKRQRVSGWFDTIWADDLPSRAVTVYMYLRSRADREGKCFPSVRTISRDTKPVSYTHLDVYKRQKEGCSIILDNAQDLRHEVA